MSEGGVFHQENSDRYGKSSALVPKGSGEGLPWAEPDRRSASGYGQLKHSTDYALRLRPTATANPPLP